MRKRFNPSSIASSDGTHVHLLHDKRANTTGRTKYSFLGKPLIIQHEKYAYINGDFVGFACKTDYGLYLCGERNKGFITVNN